MKRVRVAVIFGGKSREHDVSVLSAKAVLSHIDKNVAEAAAVMISRDGGIYIQRETAGICRQFVPAELCTDGHGIEIRPTDGGETFRPDCVFSVLHGEYGEDGRLQGMLDMAGVPYVGCGCTSSAVCMDKIYTKIIAEHCGIPTVPWLSFDRETAKDGQAEKEISEKLGFPVFIKPACGGSSFGASSVTRPEELCGAIANALSEPGRVLAERFIPARELECAVLSSDGEIIVSPPGEIIHSSGFYDYEAKYSRQDSRTEVPADISDEIKTKVYNYSKILFRALSCRQLARIDFFLDKRTSELYFNEVNTLPGFTDRSLYPRLIEETGTDFEGLLTSLIRGALNDRDI